MRRIRRGVATEAYWASTVRERNEAGERHSNATFYRTPTGAMR